MVFVDMSENPEKHKGNDYTRLPRESLFSNFFKINFSLPTFFLLKNGMPLIAFF